MILLACSNCSKRLEIDDAFAGGVCRCRHCGAIQTVPSQPGAPRTRAAAPIAQRQAAPGLPPRPLPAAPPVQETGLPGSAWPAGMDRVAVLTVGVAVLLVLLSTGVAVTLVQAGGPGEPAPAAEPAYAAAPGPALLPQ